MISNVNEAVGVLVQAAELATKQGVFSLSETRFISDAIQFLLPDYFQAFEQPAQEDNVIDIDMTPQEEPVAETPQESKKEYNL